MKKNYFNVFIILTVLMYLIVSCSTTKITNSSSSATAAYFKEKKSNSKEKFQIIGIQEELDYLTTNIEYPEFLEYEGLNKYIKNLIKTGWDNFKIFAEKNWKESTSLNSSALPPYEYYVSTSVSDSKNIISIYFEIYSYKGGAHGQTIVDTVNYDKETEKYLNITEATSYTYQELSDLCRKQLHNNLISANKFEIEQQEVLILSEMIDEGTLPIASNFESYTLDNDKLKIYFDKGKVTPEYYGIQTVILPYKK